MEIEILFQLCIKLSQLIFGSGFWLQGRFLVALGQNGLRPCTDALLCTAWCACKCSWQPFLSQLKSQLQNETKLHGWETSSYAVIAWIIEIPCVSHSWGPWMDKQQVGYAFPLLHQRPEQHQEGLGLKLGQGGYFRFGFGGFQCSSWATYHQIPRQLHYKLLHTRVCGLKVEMEGDSKASLQGQVWWKDTCCHQKFHCHKRSWLSRGEPSAEMLFHIPAALQIC